MKRIGFVDKETGEYCESYVAFIQPKRRNGFKEGWAAMGQTSFDFLAENGKLLGEEGFRVLMKLLSQTDMENYIQVNQTEMAKELNMQRPSVNRAIKKLLSIEVLFKGPKVGRCVTYMLNPNVGWKGSAKNHQKALSQIEHLKLVHDSDSEDKK